MAVSFSQIYIQMLLAVSGKENLLQAEWLPELYENITEIVEAFDHELVAISGGTDHLHIFLRLQPDMSVEDLFKKIKTQSTKFVNEQKWLKTKTLWQDGFGAFSYGRSQVDAVVGYLSNQAEYHSKKTFKDEFLNFLNKFEVEYDEENLFEWIE